MDSNKSVQFIDKYFGSMLGSMIGDALGWVYEDRGMNVSKNDSIQRDFVTWYRKAGGRFQPHVEEIVAGSYSDDTQLIFATARSLEYKNWFSHFVRIELPAWLVYERGGGGATKRAVDAWINGNPPWKLDKGKTENVKRYFQAGGNGVTMRIMPHIFFCKGRPEELTNQVFLNGIATHGHPRALLSAIVYAQALNYLVEKNSVLEYGELLSHLIETKNNWSKFPKINNIKDWLDAADFCTNGDYISIWNRTSEELVQGLEISFKAIKRGLLDSKMDTLEKLKCFDKTTRGAGTVATLVSLYMASKYAADPSAAIMDLASMKNADTDTNASMTGALLGAIHGTEWIYPEWYLVQDYDYARKLVNNVGMTIRDEVNEKLWNWSDNKKVKESLDSMEITDRLSFGPFSWIQLDSKRKNQSEKFDATTYKFSTNEGQTIYIKTVKKKAQLYTKEKAVEANNMIAESSVQTLPKKDCFIVLTSNDFVSLNKIIPSKVTISKVLTIFSELILNAPKIKDNKSIEILIKKYANKTLDEESTKKLIMFILEKIKNS